MSHACNDRVKQHVVLRGRPKGKLYVVVNTKTGTKRHITYKYTLSGLNKDNVPQKIANDVLSPL